MDKYFVESFKNFLEQDQKLWSAKKDQIIQYWKNLRPDMPMNMMPVQKAHEGEKRKSYGEDGIRITGSPDFIASILGRLKDLLIYEGQQSKLRLVFKEIESPRRADPTKRSYAFYVNVEPRSHGKAGRPKKFEF